LIDISAIRPQSAMIIAKAARAVGVRTLGAPVSGGEGGTINATFAVTVGGAAEDFAVALLVLDAMGKIVAHVGGSGPGHLVMAANQRLVGGIIELLSEALPLLEASDADIQAAIALLGGGRSRVLELKAAGMLGRQFTPGFRIDLYHKDLGIGFGVFQIEPENTAAAVATAWRAGQAHRYRRDVRQQEGVDEAVRRSGLDRAGVFVTTKLGNGFHRPDDARRAFDASLDALSFGYVDLFPIHWPVPTQYGGDYVSTWKTLEEFYRDGRARSIGISNFQPQHLRRLPDGERHPSGGRSPLPDSGRGARVLRQASDRRRSVVADSQGRVLDDPAITSIAARTGKSPAQVVPR
jgi:2,5-diketo-D-gluconate reductase A